MRGLIRYVLLALVAVTGWSFAQPLADKPPSDRTAAPVNPSLEQTLAKALQHSPDVQIAEAKVREAEAELRRTRLNLLQRVIEAHSTVDAARAKLAQAEATLNRVAMLMAKGVVPVEEKQAAEFQVA